MSHLEFVSFASTDRLKLPGLLYTPAKPTQKAAIWLHGMGDNAVFYKPELINALGQALANKGIALLAFNNRGAHNAKSLKFIDEALPEEDRRFQGGTNYELISDAIKDIDGSVAYLKGKGFSTFYLLGHSTGASKVCVYNEKASTTSFNKYVLAGPGDDNGLLFTELGEKKFWQALKYAAQSIEFKLLHIMPKYTGLYPFSAEAAYDLLNPDGDRNAFPFYEATVERLGKKRLFDEYQNIRIPTLVIFGENDEYTSTAGGTESALGLFMKYTTNDMLKRTDFTTVAGGNHSFHGVEVDFARKVADWLADE